MDNKLLINKYNSYEDIIISSLESLQKTISILQEIDPSTENAQELKKYSDNFVRNIIV